MDERGSEVTFMFQFGLIRDAITVQQSSLNLKTIKTLACDFINSKIPDHGINKIEDRLLLFIHAYNSNNILQLVNSASDVVDETLIEIVLTGKVPTSSIPDITVVRPHALSVHSYKTPTFCDFCGEMLFGLVRQGLKCEGCGQNYHKRCVVKVPNNCSYTLLDDKQRRRSTQNLQVPRSPSGGSGGSNTSLASVNSTHTEDSGLVRLANFFTGVSLD
ncbi:unnamed protein product [Acanthoscelides obtectus]|uniref:Phorbol-ester/DAG-type domain-containing protein n=1 Tax=Acanthoscelides obtectus TaxID=200917 RepID=A0A9P0KLR3_ACAOB|nr:unnamed protein product [Acanthoscelides obtectus]CAK1682028.1 Serine/threonine-protein kinase D3 [Acanthoscelides obtectus]